jgi:hypothetical protein
MEYKGFEARRKVDCPCLEVKPSIGLQGQFGVNKLDLSREIRRE